MRSSRCQVVNVKYSMWSGRCEVVDVRSPWWWLYHRPHLRRHLIIIKGWRVSPRPRGASHLPWVYLRGCNTSVSWVRYLHSRVRVRGLWGPDPTKWWCDCGFWTGEQPAFHSIRVQGNWNSGWSRIKIVSAWASEFTVFIYKFQFFFRLIGSQIIIFLFDDILL